MRQPNSVKKPRGDNRTSHAKADERRAEKSATLKGREWDRLRRVPQLTAGDDILDYPSSLTSLPSSRSSSTSDLITMPKDSTEPSTRITRQSSSTRAHNAATHASAISNNKEKASQAQGVSSPPPLSAERSTNLSPALISIATQAAMEQRSIADTFSIVGAKTPAEIASQGYDGTSPPPSRRQSKDPRPRSGMASTTGVPFLRSAPHPQASIIPEVDDSLAEGDEVENLVSDPTTGMLLEQSQAPGQALAGGTTEAVLSPSSPRPPSQPRESLSDHEMVLNVEEAARMTSDEGIDVFNANNMEPIVSGRARLVSPAQSGEPEAMQVDDNARFTPPIPRAPLPLSAAEREAVLDLLEATTNAAHAIQADPAPPLHAGPAQAQADVQVQAGGMARDYAAAAATGDGGVQAGGLGFIAAARPQAPTVRTMPTPLGGFPIAHGLHSKNILDAHAEEQRTAWTQIHGIDQAVAAPFLVYPIDAHGTPIMKVVADIQTIIDAQFQIPYRYGIAPPELREQRRYGFTPPAQYLISGIRNEDSRRFLAAGVIATNAGALMANPFYPNPTSFVVVVEGVSLHADEGNELIMCVQDELGHSAEVGNFLAQHHDAIPSRFRANALIWVANTIRVSPISIIQDGTRVLQWRIYIDPPSNIPELHDNWLEILRSFKYRTRYGGTGVPRKHPFVCKRCSSLDHPTGLCAFTLLPGWPAPISDTKDNRSKNTSNRGGKSSRGGRGLSRGRGARGRGY